MVGLLAVVALVEPGRDTAERAVAPLIMDGEDGVGELEVTDLRLAGGRGAAVVMMYDGFIG